MILQSTRDGRECDQIYTMNVDGSNPKLISTGQGRTTCLISFRTASAFFILRRTWVPKNVPRSLIFPKAMSGPVYDSFDIFTRAT